jgi:hypothetical protein
MTQTSGIHRCISPTLRFRFSTVWKWSSLTRDLVSCAHGPPNALASFRNTGAGHVARFSVVSTDPDVPTVRVDFQNADTHGRVRLNTAGAKTDIDAQSIDLRPGLRLSLVDAELTATGDVMWSDDEQLWVAGVDWDKVIEP